MHLLFGFTGRIGRACYLLSILGVSVLAGAWAMLLAQLYLNWTTSLRLPWVAPGGILIDPTMHLALPIGVVLLAVGWTWSTWALGAKRLHDIGWSGWWQFVTLLPGGGLVLFLIMVFKGGTKGPNDYGEPGAGYGFA